MHGKRTTLCGGAPFPAMVYDPSMPWLGHRLRCFVLLFRAYFLHKIRRQRLSCEMDTFVGSRDTSIVRPRDSSIRASKLFFFFFKLRVMLPSHVLFCDTRCVSSCVVHAFLYKSRFEVCALHDDRNRLASLFV